MYLKFNSKQSSTRDIASEILHLFKHQSSEKRTYYRTSLIIMHYIASLAKFGNRCSTVWGRRQDQWRGNNYTLSFRRMRKESYAFFLQHIFGRDFLSPRTTIFLGIENYPSARMSCCSDDLHCMLLPCLDL